MGWHYGCPREGDPELSGVTCRTFLLVSSAARSSLLLPRSRLLHCRIRLQTARV